MLRSHHHLRGFVKLVLWDVYCVNGRGSFRLGCVGVGFGGNCDCRCGILYAPMLGGGLVILASSPYSSELLVPTPAGNKKFQRIRRRCQNNQTHKNHPQHRSIQDTIPAVTVSSKPYTYITELKRSTSIHTTDIPQN